MLEQWGQTLGQQIFNQNMQQQIALSQQQAMNQLHLSVGMVVARGRR
ncbi:MAG TPA: hypothetical protein VFW53_02540 [Gallionella sp.]|nr:hypothetical protein [Gallionella sp.]